MNYIKWALQNFVKCILAFLDNRIPGAHKLYNSYQLGNVNERICEFDVNGTKFNFVLGPSPMSEPHTFNAQLDRQKKLGIHQLSQDLTTRK